MDKRKSDRKILIISLLTDIERAKNSHKNGFLGSLMLFKLGVSFIVLNYISLGFMQIHTDFYFNYIIYSGLLVFCCQNVATFLLYQSFQN